MSEEHETFPNAVEATLLIVVLFALQIAVASVLLSVEPFASVDPWDLSGLITVAGNGILFTLLLTYKRLRYRELFHPARHSVTSTLGLLAIPVVLLVPGLVIAAGALNAIIIKFLPMSPDQQTVLEALVSNEGLAILFGCIAAPFLEEMLFRGIILRSFLLQYSRTAAILGSATLFGIAHLNIYQFVTALAVGIVAGWLYERTRSLWPCILLHASYNGFVTYSYTLLDANVTGTFSTTFYIAAFSFAILSGLVLLGMLMPGNKKVS
jgi:membrane protease YdiL (CAAX protease family)